MKLGILDHTKIGEFNYWLSEHGRVGTSLALTPVDIELATPGKVERRLQLALTHLPDTLFLRWHLYSSVDQVPQDGHARSSAIEQIGQTSLKLVLHIEMKTVGFAKKLGKLAARVDFFQEAAQTLSEILPLQDLRSNGFNPKPLRIDDIKSEFPAKNQPMAYRQFGLDTGTEYIGILKLDKLANYDMTYITLAHIKDEIPQPFEIVVHQKKISKGITQRKLENNAKRESSPTDATGYSKAVATQEAKRNVELHGYSHFNFEMHIIIRRKEESILKEDLQTATRALSSIGDFLIESVGSIPSYVSTLPGTPFHFAGPFDSPIEEESNNLPGFLPIFTRGNAAATPNHPTAFAFHRLDYSVDFFSIYDRRYKNYCTTIVGDSGVGKSVFLNRLITCTMNSPKSKTIIVDVAGSHTRLVKRLNGSVREVNLDSPSGINPFLYLANDSSEYAVSVVSTFVNDLILQDDEVRLPEEISTDVSDFLMAYAETSPHNPSIDDFLTFLPAEFPRKKLLNRFSSKGLHKNLFKVNGRAENNERLIYYNFANIDTAANRSAARAIMSAIMAEVSFSLKNKAKDDEVIFLCDEAPFFIEACFSTFRFLNKNIRKLRGALIISVQVSGDLIVNGDSSLITNSGTSIFLSYDEQQETFKNRFKLTEEEAQIVFALEGIKGQYSQFAIKDRLGMRIANLVLEDREYWESTTEGDETALLERLLAQFPELSQEFLITVLGEERRVKKEKDIRYA